MFRDVGRTQGGGQGAASVGRWLARSWIPRVLAIALAVALLGGALYANAMYRAALSDECEVLPPVDLTMDELKDLRRRVGAYQTDPSPTAALALNGREIGVLYGEGSEFQMRVDLFGDRARVDMTVPRDDGCWNVHFAGQVSVDDGVATLVPDELRIGSADLGWFTRNATWTIASDGMPDDRLERTLANTRSLDVESGLVLVRLSNRWDIW